MAKPSPIMAPVGAPRGVGRHRDRTLPTLATVLLGATLLGDLVWALVPRGFTASEQSSSEENTVTGQAATSNDNSEAQDTIASKGPEQAPVTEAIPEQAVPAQAAVPVPQAPIPPAYGKKAENNQREAEQKGKTK